MAFCPICMETDGVIDDYCFRCSQDLTPIPTEDEVWATAIVKISDQPDKNGDIWPANCFDKYRGAYASGELIGIDLSNEDLFVKIDPDNPPKPITIPNPLFDYENYQPRRIYCAAV